MAQPIEDVHGYTSKPFNIVVERERYDHYKMSVVNNATGVIVEIREEVQYEKLDIVREELIYKWVLELGK